MAATHPIAIDIITAIQDGRGSGTFGIQRSRYAKRATKRLVARILALEAAMKPFADLPLPEQDGFTLYTRDEILAARKVLRAAFDRSRAKED